MVAVSPFTGDSRVDLNTSAMSNSRGSANSIAHVESKTRELDRSAARRALGNRADILG
jgi:hypothetical protein